MWCCSLLVVGALSMPTLTSFFCSFSVLDSTVSSGFSTFCFFELGLLDFIIVSWMHSLFTRYPPKLCVLRSSLLSRNLYNRPECEYLSYYTTIVFITYSCYSLCFSPAAFAACCCSANIYSFSIAFLFMDSWRLFQLVSIIFPRYVRPLFILLDGLE